MARVRAGDARAFEAIYERYEAPIRSFCRHLLGQPEDADDAVQHTFLAAYRAICDGDREIDLRPWLFTVARNRCRSLLRSRRRDPWLGGEAFEPSTEGLAAAVERRESLRDLVRDIGALPEDQRAALILTQLDTLRHDEVAGVLEVPTDKVKALVYQARSSLISTRQARETACHEIREQLATLSGPALRRGKLKRHLHDCSACRDFEMALKRQRAAIVVLLPVLAHPVLKSRVLGEVAGGGSGAAGAGVGAGAGTSGTVGGLVANGAALKVAVAVVAAAGAGVAGVTTGAVSALAEALPGVPQVVPSGGSRELGASRLTRKGDSARAREQPWSAGGAETWRDGGVAPSPARAEAPPQGSPPGQAGDTVSGSAPAEHSPVEGRGGRGNVPASPPGRTKRGGNPPGLTKKDWDAPGLAKKGGNPPGLEKQDGSHGLAKGQADGTGPAGGAPPGLTRDEVAKAQEPAASPAASGSGKGGGSGNAKGVGPADATDPAGIGGGNGSANALAGGIAGP